MIPVHASTSIGPLTGVVRLSDAPEFWGTPALSSGQVDPTGSGGSWNLDNKSWQRATLPFAATARVVMAVLVVSTIRDSTDLAVRLDSDLIERVQGNVSGRRVVWRGDRDVSFIDLRDDSGSSCRVTGIEVWGYAA
ncbi:MAG: hypothetical protein AAFQ53_07500 [Bacteroidota bacterium]